MYSEKIAPANKQKTIEPVVRKYQKIAAEHTIMIIVEMRFEFYWKYSTKLLTVTPAVAALNPRNANFICVTS